MAARVSLAFALGAQLAAQSWSLAQPIVSPPAALGAGMMFSQTAGKLVLFGGAPATNVPPALPFGTTWMFDGTTWTPLATPVQPSARIHPCMSGSILFGGIDWQGSPLDDTWVFDGSAWQTGVFWNRPSPRAGAAMAGGVLFGGYTGSTVHGDGWYFGGLQSGWYPGSGGPPARRDAAMVGVGIYNEVMLHGGRDAQGNLLADTWRGTLGGFIAVPGAGGPSRAGHVLVRDSRSGLILLSGGESPSGLADDLWRFDPVINRWLDVTPATRPTPVREAAAAFDVARQRLSVFGGITANGTVVSQQWEYDGPVFAPQQFGTSCSRAYLFGFLLRTPLTLRQEPLFAGRTVHYDIGQISPFLGDVPFLAFGISDTNWNGQPLPFPLGALGLTGCTLYIDPISVVPMQGSYPATASLSLPASAELIALRVFAQAFVLHPNAVAFVTNATSCQIN